MDDLISRQAAIEAIRKLREFPSAYDCSLIDKAEAQTEIMMLPSAQERKKGKWIGGGTMDLIDRRMAIKAIENLQDCYNGFSDTYDKACIIGVLEEVPSVQPEHECEKCVFKPFKQFQPKWIPAAERLPEIDMIFPHSEWYLVQYEDGGMDVASWSNVNRFWTDHVTEPHWNCVQFQTVTAWMPLPEPYRKETEDDA